MSVNPNTSESSGGDDDGGLGASAVRGIIAGFIASGIASVFVTIVDQFRQAGAQIRESLVSTGSTIRGAGGSVADTLLNDVLSVPFDLLEGLAESAGPLAPIVAPLTWALAAAVIAGVLWTIWRVLRWL